LTLNPQPSTLNPKPETLPQTELAKVRSKLEDHAGVVQACDDALSLDPDNEEVRLM
jgi:hypothetical protein